jgi:hypothetical protein
MKPFSLLIGLVLVSACSPTPDQGTSTADTATPPATAATPAPAPGSPEAKIAQAESAAPAAIASAATIMDWPATEGGEPTMLRQGTNGWVCYPATPAATGASGEDPMCLDQQFQTWAGAWIAKKPPQITATGFAYMLKGDVGASATDPFAMAQTPDNNWVQSGPHIMVVVVDPKTLDALPGDPAGGGPWVMWKGTPWAHVMMPVAPN